MQRTKFYELHKKLGAKVIPFAGFEMPVQYSSIIEEHKTVRSAAGVFDVSHMGEVFIKGDKALDFVQYITVNDASKLTVGRVQYSAMCYEDGGIVDDLLVYKLSDKEFMLVVNSSNKDKDVKWMKDNNKFGVDIDDQSEAYSLLAVQGPNSRDIVQKICDKKIELEYYHFFTAKCAGVEMILSRTGYTGELGYELYFKGDEKTAENVWNKLFEAGKEYGLQPIGLGARDTLRLEMGFCLYGNDIDQTTNPLEAGLGWITKLNKGNFIGKESLLEVKAKGLKRKLMPITSDEKVFPRHGVEITCGGKKAGHVTSGTVSPTLEKPIAMGYVDIEYCNEGKEINFSVRGKESPARFTALPFIKK
ncbi:MAG TPA: glycine cleavage system aminomethyltransferase GcvT [Ignavibacteriales bacterium]|nr:glycine cleavage system aminomethyltransferase GcvT [Ignavibacteriales bacterium]